GSGPVPGPLFSSGVLSAQIILQAGSEEQKQAYLPDIAIGAKVCTLAMTEPDYSWGPSGVRLRAVADGDGYVLNGVKLFVYDAHVADELIVVVRTGDGENDISLLMVDASTPGVSARRLRGFTSTECEVRFENV